MIFVDAGYFIAFLKTRDELHERAVRWSQRDHEALLTTEYVLVEVADALLAPLNRARFHTFLAFLRRSSKCEVLPASPALFDSGLRLHAARPDKEWSLTDCISFETMRERGLSRALAFDHHFEQAGFDALLRREP